MPSKFVIEHLSEAIELRYETRIDRLAVVEMRFDNVEEAYELIRRLKEEFKVGDFSIRMNHAKMKKRYRFEVLVDNRTLVLVSRWYPKCQSAERAMTSMVCAMRKAEVKEIFTR